MMYSKKKKNRAVSLCLVLTLLCTGLGIVPVYGETQEAQVTEMTELSPSEENGARVGSTDNFLKSLEVSGISLTPDFAPETENYTLPDRPFNKDGIYLKATAETGADVTAEYTDVNGGGKSVAVTGEKWANLAKSLSAGTNQIQIVVSPASLSPKKTYTITAKREVAFKTLSLSADGTPIELDQKFSGGRTTYTAIALAGSSMEIALAADGDVAHTDLKINGSDLSQGTTNDALNLGENVYQIEAISKDKTMKKECELRVTGVSVAAVSVAVEPNNAIVELFDGYGAKQVPSKGNTYDKLMAGATYTYKAAKKGYVTQIGTIVAGTDTQKQITLSTVPTSNIEPVNAEWSNFRNSSDNMAIVAAETPRNAEEAKVKWISEKSYLSGWNYPSPLLIVDNGIVLLSGAKSLVKLDKKTGKEVKVSAAANINGTSGYTPLTYGGGMIFVPLNDGRVQAFNAKTMESLWISETLGYQCGSPLVYEDGFLYSVNMGKSGMQGKVYCISVEDEDPSQTLETKSALWSEGTPSIMGGYWAGAVIMGESLIYGTEAVGADGYIVSRNKQTGKLIEEKAITNSGNIRSSMAYANGKVYFTTYKGYLCSLVINSDGTFGTLISEKASEIDKATSTPVVYKNTVYYGTDNKAIIAADATNLVEKYRYSYSDFGPIQASPLLTTAYDTTDGGIYFYISRNNTADDIIVVKDDGKSLEAENLYHNEAKKSYSIFSLICDGEGTLYYKNDSGYIFAVGKEKTSAQTYRLSFDVKAEGVSTEAAVTLSKVNNDVAIPTSEAGIYAVHSGQFQYKVTKSGYKTVSGTTTVGTADVALTLALSPTDTEITENPSEGSTSEKITIKVSGANGKVLYPYSSITYSKGMTAFSALLLTGLDVDWTKSSFGEYVSGIEGLYEFDKGAGSGWMYSINGKFPSVSPGIQTLKKGDALEWNYTVNMGEDIGGGKGSVSKPKTSEGAITTKGAILAKFTDVSKTDWYSEAVVTMIEKGIMAGKTETSFGAKSNITRAEFVQVLANMAGVDLTEYLKSEFDDVDKNAWYCAPVAWAKEMGITSGFDGNFRPNDFVSRQDLAVMLANYRDKIEKNKREEAQEAREFTDGSEISGYAKDAVNRMQRAGILRGKKNENGSYCFDPEKNATRGEVAAMLTNYLK